MRTLSTLSTRSIVARRRRIEPSGVVAILLAAAAATGTVGCLGHAGDAERARSHPAMNEAAKPSNEPLPASVDPGGYGEEYPERRR
jgi:hypothetical protein